MIKNFWYVFVKSIFIFCTTFLCSGASYAQAYPSKPITFVVPFPPGGITDVTARLVARKLSAELKQTVVVENKPGAGGSIGASAVAKSKADGYTLLIGTLANVVVNSYVYKSSVTYDPQQDFEPIYGILEFPVVIAVRSDKPYHSLRDAVDAARLETGALTYASSGNGTVTHLAAELLQAETKTSLVHIPYKGSSPVITDLLGGTVDIAFDYAATTKQHIDAGRLTALAVTGSTRLPSLPSVPTVAEVGFPGATVTAWIGLLAPAGTPHEAISAVSAEMGKILRDQKIIDSFSALGGIPFAKQPNEFREFINLEHRRWKPIISKADLKAN